jgi:hypothetical protein
MPSHRGMQFTGQLTVVERRKLVLDIGAFHGETTIKGGAKQGQMHYAVASPCREAFLASTVGMLGDRISSRFAREKPDENAIQQALASNFRITREERLSIGIKPFIRSSIP